MKPYLAAVAMASTLGCAGSQAMLGPAAAAAGSLSASARRSGAENENREYRFEKLPILSRALLSVNDNYVDPSRIDPPRMVVSALESVADVVPEVLVQGDATSPNLTLTVGAATREIQVSEATSIWKVRTVVGDALRFVQEHLVSPRGLREIEYAAVRGVVSTLDAHTLLLEPRVYEEMKIRTSGERGALGLVLAMRDGNLTVVGTSTNAPADRAGIRPDDVVAEIDGRSTVNMELEDAIRLVRGAVRTSVSLRVMRAGWTAPRAFDLTREIVAADTVAYAKLLDHDVAYVKLSQFAANAARDLGRAIAAQREQARGSLRGLVLDLRGNPGGLLAEAIQICDLFLSQGVIVRTVGAARRQHIDEVKHASPDPEDLVSLPLVVVDDEGSAAASEIVASALKENGRALVIGARTMGQDTIQVIHDFSVPGGAAGEETALKLTVARFLTPGGVSLKEAGTTPDVLLRPGRIGRDEVSWFGSPRTMGSPADASAAAAATPRGLELHHLLDAESATTAARRAGPQSGRALRQAAGSPGGRRDETWEANPDRLVEEYEIRLARELVERAPYADRGRMLEVAKAVVAERQQQEEQRVASRLAGLGVDWTIQPGRGTPRAAVTVSPPRGQDARAGETVPWTVTVENRGDASFNRLRAWTRSEGNPLMDGREFVFGSVKPGQRRSWTVPVTIPRGSTSWRDDATLVFEDDAGKAAPDVATTFGVRETPGPAFALSVQIDDRRGGNGDGLVQRGESFTVRVDVRNVGKGASGERTFVSLEDLGDESLYLKNGRRVIGALEAGGSASATFEAELRPASISERLPLRIRVLDETTEAAISEKIDWPVSTQPPAISATTARVHVEPPRITMVPDPIDGAPVVDGELLHVEGSATLADAVAGSATLRDVLVFVNDRKSFFKLANPASPSALHFQANVPLARGRNVVTILARVDDELQARRSLVVYRR
jgi:carboxyl-terminal processing protease